MEGGLSPAEARRQRRELDRQRARAVKEAARRRLGELRLAIGQAKGARRQAIKDAKAFCRAAKQEARRRMIAIRIAMLEELAKERVRQRGEAASSCELARREATSKAPIDRARAAHFAEKEYQATLRRLDAQARERRRQVLRPTRREKASESDEAVLANLPPEMAPLWERVKGQIRPGGRRSRTEAFFEYVEAHPSEVLLAIGDESERRLAGLIAEREQVERRARKRRYTPEELAEVPF